jgi:lysozyme
MMPKSIPQQRRTVTQEMLVRAKVHDLVCLVGMRGYFLDSMGAKGRNDFGIYDDAMILVSPHVHAAFNANVDPSRLGWNGNARKPMAVLKPGVYRYKLGQHGVSRGKPYKALVQAGPVTVLRGYGEGLAHQETGYFGINIHRGGHTTTSSEGCQTIPPGQWGAFIALVEEEMKRCNVKTVPYLLVEAGR